MRWTLTVLCIICVLILIGWAGSLPATPWAERVAAFAFFIGGGLFAWFGLQPPVIRVTAEYITCPDWPLRQRIPRSDLAYVFRGQVVAGRYGGFWQPAYFLVTEDDTPRVTISAEDFTDDGMIELAKRLDVSIRGDFTAKVP